MLVDMNPAGFFLAASGIAWIPPSSGFAARRVQSEAGHGPGALLLAQASLDLQFCIWEMALTVCRRSQGIDTCQMFVRC